MTIYQIYYLIIMYVYINMFAVMKVIKSNTSLQLKIISVIILFLLPFLGYYLIVKKYTDDKVVLSSEKIGILITATIFYSFIFLLLG